MSLSSQIAVYATFLAATLTLMRVMSGVSGSRPVRRWLFFTAIACAAAIFVAALATALMNFEFMKQLYLEKTIWFTSLSTLWFIFWLFTVLYSFGLGVLVRIYVRNLRFQDRGTIKNITVTSLARFFRKMKRRKEGDDKEYEVNAPKRDEKSFEILGEYLIGREKLIAPHLITGNDPWFARTRIVEMCVKLIKDTDEEVNYVCIVSSPLEIWCLFEKVAKELKVDIVLIRQRVVFIDAFSDLFGFKDDIVENSLKRIKKNHFIDIVTCDSAAGIHTGASKAFKILKKNAKQEKRERRPCTVVYDSLTALSIPETESEVSEFVIHLCAAETAYEMVSIIFESDLEKRSSDIIDTMFLCCGRYIKYDRKE